MNIDLIVTLIAFRSPRRQLSLLNTQIIGAKLVLTICFCNIDVSVFLIDYTNRSVSSLVHDVHFLKDKLEGNRSIK